jgi:IclR family transcriptional regulator, pca regulon regulatory protein
LPRTRPPASAPPAKRGAVSAVPAGPTAAGLLPGQHRPAGAAPEATPPAGAASAHRSTVVGGRDSGASADGPLAARGDPDFMTSLARGLAVLQAFARHRGAHTIADLSRHTGLPRAAVRRCLHTLARLDYVESDGRLFSLRPTVLTLGYAYLSSAPLPVMAQPFLERVSGAVHESCSLAVLDGADIVYVARSATRRIMSVALSVGSRLPAYCTSMGRVLLAHLPAEDLERHLRAAELLRLTELTIVSREALLRVLERTRQAGHCLVDQELEIGLRSIAVPVRNAAGTVVAAMNVSCQASRTSTRDMERQHLPELLAAARDLAPLVVRQSDRPSRDDP